MPPNPTGARFFWGVLLHSTGPQGNTISDPQPETAHCHKHNESVFEKALTGCRGLQVPGEPAAPPAQPAPPSLAAPPPPAPSPRLWEGAPTILELCCLLRGLPHSGLQCRRLPGRASAQPGRGTQTSPPQRLTLGLQLPSFGASLGRSPVTPGQS